MRFPRYGTAVWTSFAVLVGLGIPAPAQDGDDTFGLPSALAVDPVQPAVIYAGFFDYGLFKTEDGGATWSRLSRGLPGDQIAGLAIDPFDTSTVYVLEAGHGVFKSRNGGSDWRQTGFGLAAVPREIVVDPDEPLTLYAPTARGLFRSFDGAESFELLPGAPPDPAQVLFHPLDSVLTYLVAGDALAVSDDFGETWRPLGPIGAATRHVAIDPFRPELFFAATEKGVLASVDGGRAWGATGLTAPAWRLAFTATGAVLAATDVGLLRLEVLGEPWELLSPFVARQVAVHPFDPRLVFLADRNGEVVASVQGGASVVTSLRAAVPPPASLGRSESPPKEKRWRFELRPASAADPDNPVAAIAVDPDDPSVVYAASRRGVFRSTDFGARWQPASAGLELLDVHTLAVDPDVMSTVYAGTHGAGLFRSLDRGRTWFPARRGLDMAAVAAIAVDPLEPSVIYAGGRGGLYTSRDRATTWRLLDGEAASEVRALSFLRADPLALAAGTAQGRVLGWAVTADEGKPAMGVLRLPRVFSFPETLASDADPEALEIRDLAVDPEDASALWAATVYGLWRSDDGGLHWRPDWKPDEPTYNVTSVALDPLDPSVLYAGTSEGLLRRSGDRWSRVKIPGVRRRAAVHSVAFASPPETVIYAGLDDGSVAVSRDSGETWRAKRLIEKPGPPDPQGTARAREAAEDDGLEDRLAAFYAETPKTASRQRALLALERALRGSSEAAEDLERALEEIRLLQRRRGEEDVSDLRFSADSRWLLAEHRFDDGVASHSEMRLYDVHGLRLRPEGLTLDYVDLDLLRSQRIGAERPLRFHEIREPWRLLADVGREPEHLQPGWVIADPGDFLEWSPDGRYLATRSDADLISVWRIAARPRLPESRFEPVRPDDPSEQRLSLVAPGVRALAWSAGGRYLAVAGPRAVGWKESVVYLADLDRTASGTLDPLRTIFEPTVTDLRFTPWSRWLWIRSFLGQDDLNWAHLVPRSGRWKLIFERDGELWRVAPESRLRAPLPEAPRAFTELAASPDGRWLAGRPAREDGAPAAEVLLWLLGALGPTEPPHALPVGLDERGLHFSDDSFCLGLDRSEWRTWDLAEATAKVPPLPLPPPSLQGPPRSAEGSLPHCASPHWLLKGSGGVLEWPVPEPPERPPHFDAVDGIVLDGWGCTFCGESLAVWRRSPEAGWETVELPAPLDGLYRMSPDRRWVVAARRSLDEEEPFRRFASPVLRLWDLQFSPQSPQGAPRPPRPAALEARTGRFGALEFHADERARPWAGSEIVHWRLDRRNLRGREPLFDRACQVLGRNLTREEWRKYAGVVRYEPACQYELDDELGRP